MAKTQYLNYTVHLTDATRVAELNAQYPEGLIRAPYNPSVDGSGVPGGAAIEFDAPLQEESVPFSAPSLRSPWFTSGNNFPRDVATFQRKSGGWFGIPVLFGTTTRFFWVARFAYAGPVETPAIDPNTGEEGIATVQTPSPQRRVVCGFELPSTGATTSGEGVTESTGIMFTRSASRIPGGRGLSLRGNVGDVVVLQTALTGGGASAYKSTWERFYFKAVNDVAGFFWQATDSGSRGVALQYLDGGQLALWNGTAANKSIVATILANLEVGRAYKFDILHDWNGSESTTTTPSGRVRVHVDGVKLSDTFVPQAAGGIGAASTPFHHSSSLRAQFDTNPPEFAVDLDDWIISDKPALDWVTATNYTAGDFVTHGEKFYRAASTHVAETSNAPGAGATWELCRPPIDWANGSHVVAAHANAFGAGHADWSAGDFRQLVGVPMGGPDTGMTELTSSTSGARLEAVLDIDAFITRYPGVIGAWSFAVGVHYKRATGGSPQLGYKIGAASEVLETITGNTTYETRTVLYRPTLLVEPIDLADGLEIRFVKAADTNATDVRGLAAAIELVGTFSAEDLQAGLEEGATAPTYSAHPHNAPYPLSPWSLNTLAPLAPVAIVSGTYAGNGVGQDLPFKFPVHWIWVRPLSGTNGGGARWFSTMLSGHLGINMQTAASLIVGGLEDVGFAGASAEDEQEMQWLVRLSGGEQQSNASGVNYHYIAVCDPAMRFLACGAGAGDDGAATMVFPIPNPNFTPDAAFITQELSGSGSSTGHYYKGPGHAADAASPLDASAVSGALTFGEGQLTGGDAIFGTTGNTLPFACFRRDDGSQDEGRTRVVQIASYVGNGVASRSISLAPASGRRPVYAMVVPHNDDAIHRDAGHTGTTSEQANGSAIASTGITAGDIDAITVGSALNANGVTYDVFVLVGSATAGNGGFSVDGEFIPVEPDSPFDGPWSDIDPDEQGWDEDSGEFEEPDDTPIDLGENPDLDNETPLPGTDLFCVAFSQRAANIALSRIGQSRQIDDLANDETEAATVVRLHLREDVEFTLQAFPWEFARKFATLTLVDGAVDDPANPDWTYAYRKPVDCYFERRIVSSRGLAVNPTGPAFALGRDSNGGLIFTNAASAKLEYTARGLCPAYEGDQLFKDALAWRIASSIAAPLTRMPDKAAAALAEFDKVIAKAYDIQRQGNPGPLVEVDEDAVDQGASAVAANLGVINRALIRIGARTIGSLSDGSREATAARLIFEQELQSTLRDADWQFATRYAELALVGGPVTWDEALVQTWSTTRTYEVNEAVSVGGVVYYALRQTVGDAPASSADDWTTDLPAHLNHDWFRAFRVPATAVKARRLVKETARRVYDENPYPFKLGVDDGGAILFTDAEAPILEYTDRFDGIVARADAHFRDALSWKLAASLAPSLAQVDPEETEQLGRGPDATKTPERTPQVRASKANTRERMARFALARYYEVIEQAATSNANEGQPEQGGDAPWILGR